MAISITLTSSKRALPDPSDLGFGKHFSDHMFTMAYDADRGGWQDGAVVPYAPFQLDPAAGALHYGQTMFEGLKAFRQPDGAIALFRPRKHAERMQKGAARLCMPGPEVDAFLAGVRALVQTDAAWVPSAPSTSLYIRPTLIATEAFLGVRPSNQYMFFVITSPVGSYYGGGLRPVKIWVELEQTRAAKGGIGAAKAAANYVASLQAAVRAKKAGYEQVLWLDSTKHEYVEEVGTMNFMVVIGDELVTPPLSDSILAGVTRDSVLTIAPELGLKAVERPLALAEIVAAQKSGQLREVFGCGSAAVVSPVGELALGQEKLKVGNGETGPIAKALHDTITGIQRGTTPDKHGWLERLHAPAPRHEPVSVAPSP
ncbi:MAG: branched-chain amino acid aminotransferase [Polyangiaceae bacterium]